MRLAELIERAGERDRMGGSAGGPEITGIAADSRDVAPGFLFAALPGTCTDGRRFIADAIARGARAVLAPDGTALEDDRVVLLTSPDVRASLARIAAAHAGRQPDTAVAVTGTNGKTSVACFTQQLWSMQGRAAASIGTLGVCGPAGTSGPGLTTPEPVALHGCLADLARNGVDCVVLEASSHGLDQRRLDGVRLKAAGFTNFSRDHLDYHATPTLYLAAKRRLFEDLLHPDGVAVLNADIPEFEVVSAGVRGSVMSYGRKGCDLRFAGIAPSPCGHVLEIEAFGRATSIEIPLVGEFQVRNAVCAAGLVVATGADPETVLDHCTRLAGIRGRMQLVARSAGGAPVFVDYAHTPDALGAVLGALRAHGARRLVVVFGCGGDRDPGKRPMMGKVAASLADTVIVTDDNPRTEDAASIRSEILAAAPDAIEIGDRAEAIAEGVRLLGADDMLVVAGKGHETGQIVGTTVLSFDDAEVARVAVTASGGTAQ